MVYVDGFKMSGPKEGVAKSWEAIRAQQEYNVEEGVYEPAVKLGANRERESLPWL